MWAGGNSSLKPHPRPALRTLAPDGERHLLPGRFGFVVVQWEEVVVGQPSLFWSLLQQDASDALPVHVETLMEQFFCSEKESDRVPHVPGPRHI